MALSDLVRLALGRHHRQARDGDPLAPRGLPDFLALEIAPQRRSPHRLLLDRDAKITEDFRQLLEDAGTSVHRLPPSSPNLNAYAERFVLSIKSECLDRMTFFTEASLRRAIAAYVDHYHLERPHQGIRNQLIESARSAADIHAPVQCMQRLGGLLRYYYRQAA